MVEPGAPRGLIGNTDASGEVGRRVAERLARQGMSQRLITQHPSYSVDLPGAEMVSITDDGDVETVCEFSNYHLALIVHAIWPLWALH